MKKQKKLLIKNNILRSQQPLVGFSAELDSRLNEIKNFKIKKQKKNKQQILPPIKRSGESLHTKENWKQFDVENKANQIQLRINRIERGNLSFMGSKKYKNLFRSEPQCSQYRMPQIIAPPIQYIPFPVYHFLPYPPNQQSMNLNQQQINSQVKNAEKVSNDKGDKISQSRRNYLKRRLKVAFMAAYFIFVYKTYFKTILYNKCLRFLEIQEAISLDYTQIQIDIYEKIVPETLFQEFYFLTKDIENQADSSQNLSVNFQDEDIKFNVEAAQQFIRVLLDHIVSSIENGAMQQFIPIFANFLKGGLLFSSFFLVEELENMTLSKDGGYLLLDSQTSKMLIINFVFIKIVIFQLLGKKSLLGILYDFYKKKPSEKKFALFYGKKLTITLILLYQCLNRVFFSEIKKLNPNYSTLPPLLKVSPLQELQYDFCLSKKPLKVIKKPSQNELIKNVVCPPNLRTLFLNGFQENWDKIKKISEAIHDDAENYKFEELREIKKQIHENPFPNRQLLEDTLRMKFQKTQEFDIQVQSSINNTSEKLEQDRSKMSRSFKSLLKSNKFQL